MSTYPVALRSALKAAPCLLMCMGMSTIVWLYMHGLNRHSQDHVPKHSFKSTKFERAIRHRDQINRRFYERNMTWDPNRS